jgi:hypothetical protein
LKQHALLLPVGPGILRSIIYGQILVFNMTSTVRDVALDVLPPDTDKVGAASHIEDSDHSQTSKNVNGMMQDDATDLTQDDWNFLNAFPEEHKKKVVRKIDVRLIPLLTLLYLFSFIDRANIGKQLELLFESF